MFSRIRLCFAAVSLVTLVSGLFVGGGSQGEAFAQEQNMFSPASSSFVSPTFGSPSGGEPVSGELSAVGFQAAGQHHSLVLDSDGSAYAWGRNDVGQLGDGTNTDSNIPTPVVIPEGVSFTQVAAGRDHSLALASDGSVYAWGRNVDGQLGDGTNASRNIPTLVSMPEGVSFTQVAGAGWHSLAVASDGSVYAWGSNVNGQLGDGTNASRNIPTLVSMPEGVSFTQVSGGYTHSLVLASDGVAYAWGWNPHGQLGDGTNTDRNIPTPVSMPEDVSFTQVAADAQHSLAVASDGVAYAWGLNDFGQLGDGTNESRNIPTLVSMPEGVVFTQVAAGLNHSLAVASDGSAYAWGHNFAGQLGDGTNESRNIPTPVSMPEGVVFTQVFPGSSHSLALASDGSVYAWGFNDVGQLGDGTNESRNIPTPVLMPEGVVFTQVTAGLNHSLALDSHGSAYAWGDNSLGQLGDGTNASSNIPTPVSMPEGVSFEQVSGGYTHSLALASDGSAYAWGDNSLGQLGDGTNTDRNIPTPVSMPEGVSFKQIAAGANYSLALASDGVAYAWGWNVYGQLGDGTNTDSNIPTRVVMPEGVVFTQVAAGLNHSLALASDDSAYAWGSNVNGRLGDGTNASRNIPTPVLMPEGVVFTQVAAGYAHSLALASDGSAYAWGLNDFGQLGDGTNASSNIPTLVSMPEGVVFTQVSGGLVHSLALASDGSAYAWGNNLAGQLGDGTNTDRNIPTRVVMPEGVSLKQIAAGYGHSFALDSDDSAYAWGLNVDGQLGDGTNTERNIPTPVLMPERVSFM